MGNGINQEGSLEPIGGVVIIYGELWHTIRNPDESWQPFFDLLEGEVAGGPSGFWFGGCGTVDNAVLQVITVGDDSRLWHTLRNPDSSWQPFFGLVENVVAGGPSGFYDVDCVGTSQGLQVVGVGDDGRLWHTIRNPDESWQPFFGLVENVVSGGPSSFGNVCCGTTDNESLQVVGVGDGRLWHTIRNPDESWQPFFGLVENVVSGGPPNGFTEASCVGTAQGLEVFAVGADGKLWHTIRNPDESWQPFFDPLEAVVIGGPSSFFACASANTEQGLQVVAAGDDGNLWHTIRDPGGHWQSFFGLVEVEVAGGSPTGFLKPGCVGTREGLQVVASGRPRYQRR
jgi:hypothetical protein